MQALVPQGKDESEGDESDADGDRKATGRNRPTIYEKMQCIRELDRLVESGKKTGLEAKVMKTFPALFRNHAGGLKSGMLGRWLVQCNEQNWRSIPFEKMTVEDRKMKELPDWVRVPMGMPPRAYERFKFVKNIPPTVIENLVALIERVTTGGDTFKLTSGKLSVKSIKTEAEAQLKAYAEAQEAAAKEKDIPCQPVKTEVTERWANKLLKQFGWRRRAPNTYGAYLDFEDERMIKSRKTFYFMRRPGKTPQ